MPNNTPISNNINVSQTPKVKTPSEQKRRKLKPSIWSSRQAAPITKRRSFADGLKPGMSQGRKMEAVTRTRSTLTKLASKAGPHDYFKLIESEKG